MTVGTTPSLLLLCFCLLLPTPSLLLLCFYSTKQHNRHPVERMWRHHVHCLGCKRCGQLDMSPLTQGCVHFEARQPRAKPNCSSLMVCLVLPHHVLIHYPSTCCPGEWRGDTSQETVDYSSAFVCYLLLLLLLSLCYSSAR